MYGLNVKHSQRVLYKLLWFKYKIYITAILEDTSDVSDIIIDKLMFAQQYVKHRAYQIKMA